MHGLYLLWWVQERHMSAALVAAILAAGDVVLLLLEVPTGWFADRFGHRRSLILGSIAQVLGMVACWRGRGMPGLLAASVLVAVGDALRSGADQALLYRTCAALDRETDFQRVEARTRALQLAAMVGLVLAGGVIVTTWGFGAGWAAETGLCAVGLAIACAMCEPPRATTSEAACESAAAADVSPMNVRRIVALLLPAAGLAGVAGAASFLAQTAGHGDPAGVSVLVALLTLAEAAGSAAAIRAPSVGVRAQQSLLAAGLVAVAVASGFPATFSAAVVALSFLLGVAHPLRAAAIQRQVPDHVRARAASIAHAFDMAFTLIALPLAGVYRARRTGTR